MTPSQTCSADMHLLSPQCTLGFEYMLVKLLPLSFFGRLPGPPAMNG